MSTYSPDVSPATNLDPITDRSLRAFSQRRRLLLVLRAAAAGLVVFVAAMLLVALCDYLWLLSDGMRWTLSLAGYVLTIAAMWFFGLRDFRHQDPRELARQMESTAPRLREDLLSAVELADPDDANGSPEFRQRLQGRVARRIADIEVAGLLPIKLIRRWLSTGSLVAITCLILMFVPSMQFGRRFARAMFVGVPIERASRTQVNIIEPSPPSRYVAEGDAVAVVVEISGEKTDHVVMRWHTEEGVEGETVMSRRVRPNSSLTSASKDDATESADESDLQVSDVFAANLSIGTVPVEYQIHAGDAITLWHELTPLPRPRVNLFNKRYVFPNYAKLNDRVEEDEHGDLRAIIGTMAEVTVTFDEPVQDAQIRYGNRGAEIDMKPVDGSGKQFTVSMPIKTAGQYQVDATSVRSGLNNPFSPTYTVNPVVDSPPVVRWTGQLNDMQLVSPLSVMSFSGSVQDDLPVDLVIQEFRINGGAIQEFPISVSTPAREFNPSWEWDLMNRFGEEKPTPKLTSGDVVQVRLTAVDRRGRRGESRTIDLLIADDGFRADRHDHLDELNLLVSDVVDWSKSAKELAVKLKTAASDRKATDLNPAKQSYQELQSTTIELVEKLATAMEFSNDVVATNSLEMVGRAMMSVDADLNYIIDDLDDLLPKDGQDEKVWEKSRTRFCRETARMALLAEHQTGRVEAVMRGMLAQAVSLGVAKDAKALQSSLRPLADENALPIGRFSRYLTVILGRMKEIDGLVDAHADAMLDSTRDHFRGEHWKRWAERWQVQFERAIEEPPRESSFRALVRTFDEQLDRKVNAEMADGRLATIYNQQYRDIRRELRQYRDWIKDVSRRGTEAQRASDRANNEDDSTKVAEANRDARFYKSGYKRGLLLLRDRLQAETDLHRRRDRVDLKYVADLGLLQRALANVNQDGFEPYREESAATVHDNLGKAIQVLEGIHEASLNQQEINALASAERDLNDTPETTLGHGIAIERYQLAMEWPVRTLQAGGVDWNTFLDVIDETRHGSDFNQARERITRRRWEQKELVSADIPLSRLTRELATGLIAVEPKAEEARDVIRRYVLSLAEQARDAAEKAQEAKERTDERPDSKEETAKELDKQQAQAEKAAEETVQSLVDKANTADITDDQQRELARDADAAAAAVQDAAEKAEQAMDDAKNAANDTDRSEALEKAEQSLEKLKDTLKKTAEHFEKAEAGADLAESREQLRQAEEELQISDELEQRYEKAEAMADAANSDPEELLKKLEQELQRNEPMQQELSKISENAAKSAQQALEQAEQDERAVNQSLERSDPALQEQKRRDAKKMEELARRADSVKDHILATSKDASGWANDRKTQETIDKAREKVDDAANEAQEMGGENALKKEMEDTAQKMNEAINEAKKSLEEAAKQSQQASNENLHNSEKARKSAQSTMESRARSLQNRLVQDLNRERSQWAREEQEANRRIQQAQRRERDAESARKRAEDQLKKAKEPTEWQKQQIEQLKQRVEDAKRAEEAAEQSRNYAREQRKATEKRSSDLRKEKRPSLDRKNPAAQLAEHTAKQAEKELERIQQELGELAKEMSKDTPIQAQQNQAQNLANKQQNINEDVDNAAEQVARASRHEDRLGKENAADQLEKAAESIQENGLKAGEQAQKALEAASEAPKQSSDAGEQVGEAKEKIGEDAEKLAKMLDELGQIAAAEAQQMAQEQSGQPQQGQPSQQGQQSQQSGQQSDQPSQAQQLAQTLDELDRAIAEAAKQQQGQQSQQGQPSQQGQQTGQQPGQQGDQQAQQSGQQQSDQQGQQPGQQQGQPGQQTAGQASPTLQQMLDSQQQQAAKQRQQMQNGQQGQPGQQETAQTKPGEAEGENMGENPGPGMADENSGFLKEYKPGELGQWGQLRERRTDDAAESRGSRVAPQYRREVEAYFRAIAKRAAEREGK